jgi:hypothetical protein
MPLEKSEYEKKTTKKYIEKYYYDPQNNIDILSSRVFLDEDKIITYPFGNNNTKKYKNIESIEIIDFNKKGPTGISNSPVKHWGFTKNFKPFADYLDKKLKIKNIIILNEGENQLDLEKHTIQLNNEFLSSLNTILQKTLKYQKKELEDLVLIELHKIFPNDIIRPFEKYKKDDLSKVLKTWGNDISEFSDSDKTEIINLYNKLSMTSFIDTENLQKTKQVIDKKYIDNTISEFEKLITLSTDSENLEKNWQKFLQQHNWIFGTIFAQPIILFQREAYVGGKTIDNSDGKFTDFLLKNKLTNNVSFFEIKTHLTKIMEEKAYRGTDVFAASKELTGCISQVINQRDNFQKEFYTLKGKSKEHFEAFNCKCIVLIGNYSKLKEEQKKSFELFRQAINDVTILTFDEVLEKLKTFSSLIS